MRNITKIKTATGGLFIIALLSVAIFLPNKTADLSSIEETCQSQTVKPTNMLWESLSQQFINVSLSN